MRNEPPSAVPLLLLFVVVNLILVGLGVWKVVELVL